MQGLIDHRFLPLAALGRGATAAVVRAFDAVDERIVALKFLDTVAPTPRHPGADEFEAFRRVRHPAVVSAFELGVTHSGPWSHGRPYLVLEAADGSDLGRLVARGRLDPQTVEEIAVELLRALEVVHEAGIVHRDIKPQNIVWNGALKLTDFGLAVPIGSRRETGHISGTLRYIAPEAILGQPLDGRTDLYATGLLLAYLLRGRHCCPARQRRALRFHLEGRPVRLDPSRYGERLTTLIEALTARLPASRFESAGAALAQLGVRPQRLAQDHRVDLWKLRLDLDALRLGERRIHPLPTQGDGASQLIRAARTWAEVRRVPFLDSRQRQRSLRRLVRREAIQDKRWRRLGRQAGLYWHRSAALATPDVSSEVEELSDELLRLCAGRGLVVIDDQTAWGERWQQLTAAPRTEGSGRCGFLLLTRRRW